MRSVLVVFVLVKYKQIMYLHIYVRKGIMEKAVETGGSESCDGGSKQHKTPTIQL